MTGRDPYAEVGRAMRDSIERALTADLSRSGNDWKVLGALFHEIASYSRLSDRVYTARLAELTRPVRAQRAEVGCAAGRGRGDLA